MANARVLVTGVGFVTSIGLDKASVISSLRQLQSGIECHDFLPGIDLPIKVAGTIKGFDTTALQWAAWRYPEGYRFPREALRGMPPHGLYAHCAVEQACADARLERSDIASEETGLFCASGGSPRLLRHHLNQINESNGQRVAPMGVISSISGTLNFNLGAYLGIRGAVAGYSSACASTAQAIGYAIDEIKLGRLRRVLVVGGEDVSFESIYPFYGMRALSRATDPARASRPFDRDRDGFVGTGGSVALWLEEASSASIRGAPVYAELVGWGQSADGTSITQSDPAGNGIALAMSRALKDASMDPGRVTYVNAHATSTPAGDASEGRAIARVFEGSGHKPWVSSTKALTGHGLSLAGAMETAFCALAIAEQFVPGAANLDNPDPELRALRFPRATEDQEVDVILKNSSGFGGTNVSLVLARRRS